MGSRSRRAASEAVGKRAVHGRICFGPFASPRRLHVLAPEGAPVHGQPGSEGDVQGSGGDWEWPGGDQEWQEGQLPRPHPREQGQMGLALLSPICVISPFLKFSFSFFSQFPFSS